MQPETIRPQEFSNKDIEIALAQPIITRKASGPADKETHGHRLFTKSKKEFKDLRDYAKKLLNIRGILNNQNTEQPSDETTEVTEQTTDTSNEEIGILAILDEQQPK